MLKILKWVYNLGKAHEKRRIESEIMKWRSTNGIYLNLSKPIPGEDIDKIRSYIEGTIRGLLHEDHNKRTGKRVIDE